MIDLADTSKAHMSEQEVHDFKKKQQKITANTSYNYIKSVKNNANLENIESQDLMGRSRISDENVYLNKNYNRSRIGEMAATQVDLSNVKSHNFSSFSSENNSKPKHPKPTEFTQNRVNKIKERVCSEKSLKDINSNDIETVFLPNFAKDDQFVQTNNADKSDNSTVFSK